MKSKTVSGTGHAVKLFSRQNLRDLSEVTLLQVDIRGLSGQASLTRIVKLHLSISSSLHYYPLFSKTSYLCKMVNELSMIKLNKILKFLKIPLRKVLLVTQRNEA